MRQHVVVDGRNIYDPQVMIELGFKYRGVGRGYDGDGRPVEKVGLEDIKTA
jgi:UDPglucose 6-dehydrogenase